MITKPLENTKIGDVVRLKSGGPDMTVEAVGPILGEELVVPVPDGQARCVWIGDGPILSCTVPVACLDAVVPDGMYAETL